MQPEIPRQRARFLPYPPAFKYRFLCALRSAGRSSIEPMRSETVLNAADSRRAGRAARCRRSRTTADFEHFRPRDSASISETRGSGSRTVNVFIREVYYITGGHARQTIPSCRGLPVTLRQLPGNTERHRPAVLSERSDSKHPNLRDLGLSRSVNVCR